MQHIGSCYYEMFKADGGDCGISDFCWELMMSLAQRDYVATHQLLFIIIAQKVQWDEKAF